MSETIPYSPTPQFKEAASFLSNVSSLSKTPNETKLEIYGIYKFLTVSPEPTASRPSIFSPTERAKYDAWKSVGVTWQGKQSEAEKRYIEIAQSLGWIPGTTVSEPTQPSTERSVEELLAEDSDENPPSRGSGNGMGPSISTMRRDEPNEEKSLHSIAIEGDVEKLQLFLETHAAITVNAIDEYGFTALHLASDRGKVDAVKFLLSKGADANLKDSDGLSALDLALEANHEDVAALLRNTS